MINIAVPEAHGEVAKETRWKGLINIGDKC